MRPRVLLSLLCLLATPLAADEVKRTIDDIPTQGHRLLGIHLPVGNVLLEPGDGDDIALAMAVNCSSSSSSCRKKAEELDIITHNQADRLLLKIGGLTQGKIAGLTIDLHLRVPRAMAVEMNIGTGNVAVRYFAQDLEVDVGVGDVEATLSRTAVQSLELDTGIGSIRLDLEDQTLRGAGLVGSHLDWSQGQAGGAVEVDCGVGDIDITLH